MANIDYKKYISYAIIVIAVYAIFKFFTNKKSSKKR